MFCKLKKERMRVQESWANMKAPACGSSYRFIILQHVVDKNISRIWGVMFTRACVLFNINPIFAQHVRRTGVSKLVSETFI